jgi:hypothetical protein
VKLPIAWTVYRRHEGGTSRDRSPLTRTQVPFVIEGKGEAYSLSVVKSAAPTQGGSGMLAFASSAQENARRQANIKAQAEGDRRCSCQALPRGCSSATNRVAPLGHSSGSSSLPQVLRPDSEGDLLPCLPGRWHLSGEKAPTP